MRDFSSLKDDVKEMERQTMDSEKILAKCMSKCVSDLYPGYINSSYGSILRRQPNKNSPDFLKKKRE